MIWEEALAAAVKWSIIITMIALNIIFVLSFLIKWGYKFLFEDEKKNKSGGNLIKWLLGRNDT